MSQLRIRIFGGLAVHRGNHRLPPFPTRKSEGLFGYLVMQRSRLVHRDVLCGELWGEHPEAEARKALRTALWRIRCVVEPEPDERGTILRVEGDQVGLAASAPVWVDAWELEECLLLNGSGTHPLDAEVVRRLERAVGLYRGDFLEGHYEEWCFLHQERLRLVFLTELETLLHYYREREEWLAAISWAHQILRHDPLREHVHRALMRCHHAMGDRPSALRQYATCTQVLRDELDIEPMEETRDLYEQIRRGDPAPAGGWAGRSSRTGSTSNGSGGVLAEVDRALEELQALASRLERTRAALRAEPSRDDALAPPTR